MKNENGYWVDDNNNSWNEDFYTIEEAKSYSETLINCKGCTNCTNCEYCRHCTNCRYCTGCKDCTNCRHCKGCTDCEYCTNCEDCTNCKDCGHCKGCRKCANCINCRDCKDCPYCTDCEDCIACASCKGCIGCRYCEYLRLITSQPQIYTTNKIGSRKSRTIFIYSEKQLFVRCGCFWGTLAEFESAVEKTHGSNKYAVVYRKEIAKVKILFEREGQNE